MKLALKLGGFNEQSINQLLSSKPSDPGDCVAYVSSFFLGKPYKSNTLPFFSIGEEPLVVNLEEMDCMTLLEYVEALRVSKDFEDFKKKLACVRYKGEVLSYQKRRHYFSDWIYSGCPNLEDVTHLIHGDLRMEERILSFLAPYIEPQRRILRYLPSSEYKKVDFSNLRNGDYVGFVSEKEGLDFDHVGIVVKKEGELLLRHASSRKGFVLDEDFNGYLDKTCGFVVLRPK